MAYKNPVRDFKLVRKKEDTETASRRFATKSDDVAYLTVRCLVRLFIFLPN
jgi:hypothetical protein